MVMVLLMQQFVRLLILPMLKTPKLFYWMKAIIVALSFSEKIQIEAPELFKPLFAIFLLLCAQNANVTDQLSVIY